EQPGTYFLQVGSFRNGEQADRFKAELALLGLETSIQKVTIDNKATWHRVRVGPYSDLEALNRTRRTLRERGVESTLVKVTGQ
ncbi:MAG: SPOR domain-containing protein, partial [Gammaproteobacteria bacterium]